MRNQFIFFSYLLLKLLTFCEGRKKKPTQHKPEQQQKQKSQTGSLKIY